MMIGWGFIKHFGHTAHAVQKVSMIIDVLISIDY